MIHKEEEIYEWFKGAVSSQRIDVVCSLLRLCLPLELRFIGSCLEDLARKDYVSLREYELKSNESSGYTILMADSPGEELQNTLNIYVSLLHSTNTVCANSLFHILEGLQGRLQRTLSQGLSGDSKAVNDEKITQDFLLLFTMAVHHPAFTFSQRIKLFDCLKSIKQLFCELGLIKLSHKERNSPANSSVENSTLPVVSASTTISGNQSQLSLMPAPNVGFCRVRVTTAEPRRNNKNRSLEYHLEATWYEGEMEETWKSFKDLKTFHEKVENLFSKIVLHGEGASCCLPLFPSADKFLPCDWQMADALNNYFRELCLLPMSITHEDKFRRLFHELMKRPDTATASASVSTSFSVSLSVTKAEVCLSAPSSPHSVSPSSQLSKKNTTLSSDCLAKLVAVTSQSTTASAQSSRSNHLLESTTGNVSSSQSPLSSSRSSPFLSSQGNRSRHNSSQGSNSIAVWLKEIRLHKYTDKLAKYTWDELYCLSEADLQREGFTSGACKKFANEIHNLRSKSGTNLDFPLESTSTSRLCNPSGAASPSHPAAPLAAAAAAAAAFIAKSLPGVSSPGSIDSSCSEYSTPPGSPEPRQSSSGKSRARAVTGSQQQSQPSAAGSDSSKGAKEKDKIFVPSGASVTTVVPPPVDVVSDGSTSGTSDVPVIRSISLESSLAQRCSAESFGGQRPFLMSVETPNSIAEPDEPSDVGSITSRFAFVHESQSSPPLLETSRSAVDLSVVSVSPGVTSLAHWPVNPSQPWSQRAVAVRPFMASSVSGGELPPLGPRLHTEGTSFAKKQLDAALYDFVEEVTCGLNARMPAPPSLDSSAFGPAPMPIPSDAVLVRPRLPVGMPPVARIPAVVSTIPLRLHDVTVVTSIVAPVADTVATTTSSPFIGNTVSGPRVPLQPPPPHILYPQIVPVSPAAFHPPIPILPTPNKPNLLPPPPPQPSDVPNLTSPSAVAVLPPPTFSVDPTAPADLRSLDSSSMPPGMATFVPGFFNLPSPLPTPPSNMPMMHAGLSYSVTMTSSVIAPVSHTSNVASFPAADDSSSDDIGSVCHQCGHWQPNAIIYPNMWPVEFPQSTCFSVGANNLVTQQHGSPPFRPLCGTQVPFRLPNGISPELHYQAACSYSLTGTRPMHAAARPTCAGPVPHYMIRCRSTAPVPLLTCSNCGASGHSHLECNEQTIESAIGSGQFQLGLVPKTETG